MRALLLLLAFLPSLAEAHCALASGRFFCNVQKSNIDTSTSTIVSMNVTHQTMEGFGAADAVDPTDWRPFTDPEVQTFFDPAGPVALSVLRIWISEFGTYAGREDAPGTGTIFPSAFGDYTLAKRAAQYGVRLVGTPWTPPAASKSNNALWPGGSLNAGSYSSWATTLASWATYIQGLTGYAPYAIGAQNEPDFSPSSYQGCTYTTAQMASFLEVLGPKIAALNPRPLLYASEPSNWSNLGGYVTAIEADSNASPYVDRYAAHQYGQTSAVAPTSSAKPYWQTEMAGLSGQAEGTWDASITDGVAVALWIHNAITTGNVSMWLWWWLVNPYNEDNEGLIGHAADNLVGNPGNSPTYTKRLYVLGNFSKFVRPGSIRVDVSGTIPSGVSVTAYKDPGAYPVIVAINSNSTSTSFSVAVQGGAAPTSMNPWVTDSTRNLVKQGAVSVSNGIFTYSLPATSVTTFEVE